MNESQPPATIPLSLAALNVLPGRVGRPAYARADLRPGIVHFGVGNFHRAHMAVYLDALFSRGEAHDWAIVGAGVTAYDEAMRVRLSGQDFLSCVVEQDANVTNARVTGAMVDFIDPADNAALIARLADPAIRIVSLTITEGGYFIDPATGRFDPDHAEIQRDAADPVNPRTVFGLILAGIARRRAAGVPPFTVMSCDNVPHNGVVTRNALVGLARLTDPALAAHVAQHVAFPNAMVDRITPATGQRERALLASDFGIADASPVFCETFRQWVIEDTFSLGRPALETVGVTFVPDVTPYEVMKIRILNGGHAAIAYPAGLFGIVFVHDAMSHPLVLGFLRKLEREEIIPVVPPVPNTDLQDYYQLIEQRFANPRVGDTIRRLCLDGSNRQPKFIIPTIADALKAGQSVAGLALESALWCRYCYGETDAGETIEPNDPNWDRMNNTARAARSKPEAWLAMRDIYGDTGEHPIFRAAFAAALDKLWTKGTARTIEDYLGQDITHCSSSFGE
jgi:mannitol 2-dehydrogenase